MNQHMQMSPLPPVQLNGNVPMKDQVRRSIDSFFLPVRVEWHDSIVHILCDAPSLPPPENYIRHD